ncbi:MAG: carboxypeptidase-like regulatory domain-containing protein [Pyrinomonadaceae bacterium]|nr:carboxypeptidase-like regulatory domain-containing protein [Pyrinomonadaceae bacterium]
MNKIRLQLLLVMLLAAGPVRAQAPTGTVVGVVTDAAGAPVAGARLRLTNRDSGLTRSLTTSEEGNYSAAALPPGVYQVTAEAEGFHLLERTAALATGATTTLNLTLQVGELSELVTVDTAVPLMQYDQHHVSGLVGRNQIEDLPLNGRNFLELAKLEPGIQPPTRAASNRTFVPALGQPVGNSGRGTRVTVDGGSIMAVGNGGSAMGFSQEVVQEFQVATVNFDLTTGLTNGAAINVITRSGANELHGTALYFFRDHKLAAYPALNRVVADPDPFFQRRLRLGINFSYASAPPFSAFVGGSDFNGDGTTDDLLPGTTVNAFNRSLVRAELESLVAHFNQTHAGKPDGKGELIPRLTLPSRTRLATIFNRLICG